VKRFWEHPFLRSRYLPALLAGILLTLAFPNPNVAGLAWIAPGLMVAATLGTSGMETFRIGYVSALAHYLSLLYWLLLIPYRWHGLPLAPALGWLSLSAFLSLFPAFWVWALSGSAPFWMPVSGFAPSKGPELAEEAGPYLAIPPRSWVGRLGWALFGAAAWVAWEMVLARILGGFPWAFLGASQFRMLPLIQVASVTGIYGVSFLVVWVSLSLLSAGLMVIRRPTARSVWLGELFLPVLVVALCFNLGWGRMAQEPPSVRTLKTVLLQPSIPQTLIWDESKDEERFQELIRLSELALQNEADLMIWPEAAMPRMLRYDQPTFDALTGLARRHKVWMIVGSDDKEPGGSSRKPEDVNFYNSSFLISPEGQLVDRYVKRNLVIFGEYLPLQQWLPFLKWFTPIEGGFTPGPGPVPFELKNLNVRTSVLICFEDMFPQLARADVRSETDFLVNITNDGWFGEGPAQWQQATSALFRTVETGRPLLRCANNGVTCWIDSSGRLRDVFRDNRGTVYGPGFLRTEIPLSAPGTQHPPTFYVRHGDIFGWSCVGISAVVVGLRLIRSFRSRRTA
jgi:apolipoprotein N-acyltransferase